MTEKRFVYYEHKGAEYILEDPNTHLDFIEMLGDCLDEKEIVNRLNELYDENEQLKHDATVLIQANQDYRRENEELKQFKEDFIKMLDAIISAYVDLLNESWEENEQLKQRNDRQAKQLDRLYNLIEEKDWRTLIDILDDFKRCEEQLQKEWGTYGDVE